MYRVKLLYHFTNWVNDVEIGSSGVILTTESNIGSVRPDLQPYGEHLGPDVVWLTDSQSGGGCGLRYPAVMTQLHTKMGLPAAALDKRKVRSTCELPDEECHHWPAWATAHGINRRWQRIFEKGQTPWTWWLIERPITPNEIVKSEVMDPELTAWLDSQGVLGQYLGLVQG